MALWDYFRPATLTNYFNMAVNTQDLAHFLQGYMLTPDQGSILSVRYVMDRDRLEVTNHAGELHSYDDVTPGMAGEFYDTYDKDGWLRHVYTAYYREVHGGRAQTLKDTEVLLDSEYMRSFLEGKNRLHFTSSFGPVEALYDKDLEAMECTFLDGFTGVYERWPLSEAEHLAAAISKGKWMHTYVKLGYNPDRTWIHKYPLLHGMTLEQYRKKR